MIEVKNILWSLTSYDGDAVDNVDWKKKECIFRYVFQASLTMKGRTYSRRNFLASLATSFKNEIWSEINARQFFLQVNSPVRRVGHVCRFGETLKTVIHKVAAAATKENLLARI